MTDRYHRQILLPEIGPRGQEKLARATVFVAGAGGLGSASAFYLAAAGIGRIRLADCDRVDLTNLNRQILHTEDAIDQIKVVSADKRLRALNSEIQIEPVKTEITDETIGKLVDGVDIIVDACDNYATRKTLNRASLEAGIPYIFGGVAGFEGMVSTFVPGRTACFECIIKDPKTEPGIDQGIVGPTAGLIGSFQAMEVLKLALGTGKPLENRLLRVSGLDMRVHTLSLTPNPDCPACKGGTT